MKDVGERFAKLIATYSAEELARVLVMREDELETLKAGLEALNAGRKHDIDALAQELGDVLPPEHLGILLEQPDLVERIRDVLDAHDLARLGEFVRRADMACLRVAQKSGAYAADLCSDEIHKEFKLAPAAAQWGVRFRVGTSMDWEWHLGPDGTPWRGRYAKAVEGAAEYQRANDADSARRAITGLLTYEACLLPPSTEG